MIRRPIFLTFVACFVSLGADFYVSPAGTPTGNGSIANPWDLQTALFQPPSVKPGDTIWLRAGTYGNGLGIFYSWLVGTSSAPIIVRQYPGERAIIDNWLQVGCCDQNPQPAEGAYVWFWGLEFASSVTDRTGSPAGPPNYGSSTILDAVDSWAPGSRFIHNIIHDTRMGISLWTEALNAEAYGNVIYFNGFQASDRGHGHGFYVQNNTGTKSVTNNIMFDQFDNGMQFYGTDAAYVRNLLVQGNISFNNGSISTGPQLGDDVIFANTNGVSSVQLLGNHLYFAPQNDTGYNELGWTSNLDIVAQDNYFIGGFEAVSLGSWTSVVFENNTVYSKDKYLILASLASPVPGYTWNNNAYYGSGLAPFQNGTTAKNFSGWQGQTGFDSNSTFQPAAPTGVWTFVEPSKYETGRANIVIYNWDLNASVPVDVSSAITPGASYEIRDVENYFGPPVASGVYSGAPISIPMSGLTIATPSGAIPTAPVHTAPQFGVFVILETNAPVKPVVLNVSSGAGAQPAIEAGSWVSIYGVGLANTTDIATAATLPTVLDGVSATIDGQPAFVYAITPGQINLIAPASSKQGSVQVTVTNNGVTSETVTAQLQPFAPSFFLWGASFYPIATRFPDYAYIANPAVVPGTVAAKPGDILTLWGTGFGATNPLAPAGTVVTGVPVATTLPTVTVGGTPVTVLSAVLSPGSIGLYQVAIQLPTSLPGGNQPVVATASGYQSPAGVNLFISAN